MEKHTAETEAAARAETEAATRAVAAASVEEDWEKQDRHDIDSHS